MKHLSAQQISRPTSFPDKIIFKQVEASSTFSNNKNMETESSEDLASLLEFSLTLDSSFEEENDTCEKETTPIQTSRQKNKQKYGSFKNKLQDLLPAVFKKDVDRGNFIFDILCDIIRINNLIDTSDDIPSIEFILTEQRIKWALENFFSIRQILSPEYTSARYLKNYMNPYKSQFKEIGPIGSGGFGRVFKAQHLLDGVNYAVKKISIKARREKEIIKCLDEVKILAQLNHHNIVSYKQAWIEALDKNQIPGSSRATSGSADSDYLSRADSEFFHINSNSQNKSCCEPAGRSDNGDFIENSVDEDEPVIVLYIQMNLCERNLREWMDDRIESSSFAEVENIATQILSGLEFIHERNFIHHDIKPQNIFVSVRSETIHVQIGDFGLACCLNDELEHKNHSQEIGTVLYVAPEQKDKICDQKSDTYSFGIVLFELMSLMQSEMERIEKISELKAGIMPLTLQRSYPSWVGVMEKSLLENLDERPTAKELLQQFKNDKDLKIFRLEQSLKLYKEENALIAQQLRKKDEALAAARNMLLVRTNWTSDQDDFPLSDDSN